MHRNHRKPTIQRAFLILIGLIVTTPAVLAGVVVSKATPTPEITGEKAVVESDKVTR